MKSKELDIKIKKKTFDTCILPCIIYGCETRALIRNHRDKLAKCQKVMTRVTVWYPEMAPGAEAAKYKDGRTMKVILGPLSLRVAADRRQRKKLEEAYVQGTPNAETYCK
ncbi:hypothetical protein EVAR_98371_1 [Eumeta japonica]|uniref:Uncharacterized protein n=1 Tax=Eumeta variegata TaxID=151549 RepID=A0A4C2A854_EUMVA|nr:hypothetical protein EVAR_98371_1 [Eumeta japonica]